MKLSICLASYNGEKFIKEQMESILQQLKDGDELIIGDDGSTDKTLEIIQEYGSRITTIFSSKIGGVNQNFERLILASKNSGIVLADQDDVWLPNRLELIRAFLKESSLVITNGWVVDEHLNQTGKTIFEFVNFRRGFINNFVKNSYVGCCMAFKRSLISAALPFSKELLAHDWLIGLLGEIDGRISVVQEPTILYRRHSLNFSETGLKSSNTLKKKVIARMIIAKQILSLSK
jgi:glycosyltransferase involved in cell wall biosynthesis